GIAQKSETLSTTSEKVASASRSLRLTTAAFALASNCSAHALPVSVSALFTRSPTDASILVAFATSFCRRKIAVTTRRQLSKNANRLRVVPAGAFVQSAHSFDK